MDRGNPSLADEGEEEERRMGEGGMEGEEGKGRRRGGMGCVARGSSGMEADRSAAAPALLDGPLLLLLGVDGRPQISAALSHRHVTGRGQWHRQYLNQLHCSSAIGGALRRQGSYWRQRPCGERASGGGEKGFLRIEKERRQRIGGRGAVVSQWKLVQTANLC